MDQNAQRRMKTKTLSLCLLGTALAAASQSFGAEVRTSTGMIPGEPPDILSPGWYIGGLFRGNFVEDTNLKQFGGPTTGTVRFDPGAGFSARGGYRFCEWFSLEGEIGFEGNNISSITGAFVDAALYQVPYMANAVLTIPTRSLVIPYGGFGVGGTTSILDINDITIGTTTVVGSEARTTFAWQAFGGLEFILNNRLSVGVMYNYRSVDGPKWDRSSFPIEFDDLHNHSVSARVNYHF